MYTLAINLTTDLSGALDFEPNVVCQQKLPSDKTVSKNRDKLCQHFHVIQIQATCDIKHLTYVLMNI